MKAWVVTKYGQPLELAYVQAGRIKGKVVIEIKEPS